MSESILIYQVVIFAIVFQSAFAGRVVQVRTTVAVGLWTLTHVFMPWLLAVQCVTIAAAFVLGRKFAADDFKLLLQPLQGNKFSSGKETRPEAAHLPRMQNPEKKTGELSFTYNQMRSRSRAFAANT